MNLVEELSGAERIPIEAMRAAMRTPDRIAGGVLRVLDKAGSGALTPRETNLLFWGLHVLAGARDTRVFRPLLALLVRSTDDLDEILGDAVTGTLSRVVASTFDGDGRALVTAIVDPATEEYARWALLNAVVTLAVAGRIARDDVHDLLVRFDEARHVPAAEAGWIGWGEAIACLGFADLAPRVTAALAEGRLLDDQVHPDWFEETMAEALARPDAADRLPPLQFGFMVDAAVELDEMLSAAALDEDEVPAPIVNPLRHVGRNDPCPCGSGRKFKACCLGKPDGAAAGPKTGSLGLDGSRPQGEFLPPFLPRLPPMRGR